MTLVEIEADIDRLKKALPVLAMMHDSTETTAEQTEALATVIELIDQVLVSDASDD